MFALRNLARHATSKSIPTLTIGRRSFNTTGYQKPLKAGFSPGALLFIAGVVGIGLYSFDARSALDEYIWCPLIRFCTSAETGHKLGVTLLKLGLNPKAMGDYDDPRLKVDAFGRTLSNPIGMAAGFDKQGECMDSLFDLGFGSVEVGTVTPEPQPGNNKPRFFRLSADEGAINRYGINSEGHMQVLSRLRVRLHNLMKDAKTSKENNAFREGKSLWINVGKNTAAKGTDGYVLGIQRFAPYADGLVVNVSCPNAAGIRDLQEKNVLTDLLTKVREERDKCTGEIIDSKRKPVILVKISPDLTEQQYADVAKAAKQSKVDGIIVSNTTTKRPDTLITKGDVLNEKGGLSGRPLKPLALQALRTIHKYTQDSKLILVGCGGISTGKDALEFARAGASLVEVCTAFGYKGPGLPFKMKQEITEELEKEGKSWMDIVGSDSKKSIVRSVL